MTRVLKVGAAQLGPIQKEEKRKEVVQRLIALLQEGASLRPIDQLLHYRGVQGKR